MRGELEGAVEGIGDGEKISWEERGQLTLPHHPTAHKCTGAGGSVVHGATHPPRCRSLDWGSLRFLADQFDRSAREIVTPALCIRFAVDSWVGFYENCVPCFRGIPKKSYCGQAAAGLEGSIPDAGDTVRNSDARQAPEDVEGPDPDAGDTVWDSDACQAPAASEGVIPDAGDAVRNRVIGTCLAGRIIMQQRLLCIKQNPIDNRVIHVPHTNLNCRQAVAAIEGP